MQHTNPKAALSLKQIRKHQTFLGSGEIFGVCHLGSQASVLLQKKRKEDSLAAHKTSEEENKRRQDTEKVQAQRNKRKSSPCPADTFADVSQRLWSGENVVQKHIVKASCSLSVSKLYSLCAVIAYSKSAGKSFPFPVIEHQTLAIT